MPKEKKLKFDEESHTYTLGKKKLISVTQLMQKHGLSPDYSNIDPDILRKKAERGSLIHEEIHNFLLTTDVGFTDECADFAKWYHKDCLIERDTEKMCHNDIVAGTVDFVYVDNDGKLVIVDFKTTAQLHRDALSWQLSIYAALLGINPDRYEAFHFAPDGLKVVEIIPKPREEVERLFQCERDGIIYEQSLAVSDNALAELAEVESLIKGIEEQKKKAEAQAAELREAIIKAMKENGVTTFDNERMRITYVAPQTRQSVDTKKLKEEFPEAYEGCLKESVIKESLRIKIKEGKDEG